MKFMIFGGVVVTLLTAFHAVAPQIFSFLPLGGSSIAEIGIVLSVSFACATLNEMRKKTK